ncbi:MAG: A24 family peptidase [Pseudomonadota bacterium]
MAEPELPEVGAYSPRLQVLICVALVLGFVGLAMMAGALSWDVGWVAISVGLAGALIALSTFDLNAHILPDVLTLPLLLAGLVMSGLCPVSLFWSGIGAAVGYGLIAGLRWLWLRRRGVEAIGLGDAKLLAAGGAWVGASGLPLMLLVASGLGLLAALLSARYFVDKALPFGVFLSIGIWVSWCFWLSPQVSTAF